MHVQTVENDAQSTNNETETQGKVVYLRTFRHDIIYRFKTAPITPYCVGVKSAGIDVVSLLLDACTQKS